MALQKQNPKKHLWKSWTLWPPPSFPTAHNGQSLFETARLKSICLPFETHWEHHSMCSPVQHNALLPNTTCLGCSSDISSSHFTNSHRDIADIYNVFNDFTARDSHVKRDMTTRMETIDAALMHHCTETLSTWLLPSPSHGFQQLHVYRPLHFISWWMGGLLWY